MTGLVAQFASADAALAAVRSLRSEGCRSVELSSPYPLREEAREAALRTHVIPVVAFGSAAIGAAIAFAVQWWTSAVDYPLDIGGRPLLSWPAFIPATVIVAMIWGAVGTFIAMLRVAGLPRLHHPVFEAGPLDAEARERFLVYVDVADDGRALEAARHLLRQSSAVRMLEVEE